MRDFNWHVERLHRQPYGARDWFSHVQEALEALAAERAAARRAKTAKALDELARIDAPLIGEPRSFSHWGMH